MTMIQEKAYEMIKQMPEDKLYYVVQLLEGINGLLPTKNEDLPTTKQCAYEELQKFRKCNDIDMDYKAELAKAREEKYAGIN